MNPLLGQLRINAWAHPDLLACAIPGPISNVPGGIRPIFENKDPQHKRVRPLAILNASDMNGPDDLRRDGASCLIKMSAVSVDDFRQAFPDPDSRIRLHSDQKPKPMPSSSQ